MNLTSEQLHQYMEDLRRCSDKEEIQPLPFSEWKTRSPIVKWFGSVQHTLAALVFTISLGGIWLWVFRDQPV